ncbi:MAG: polysaccharide pyruvyl transferase family protein [Candidatus Omnitrophica bacterium]|nr:polysaccharide pyruvyl transferase family protein [Candidatus Omnitrophota bacterium]
MKLHTQYRSIKNNWPYLLPFAKRIGYIGWVGYDNLGDEAMLLAFQKLFSPAHILPYKYTRKMEIFEQFSRRDCYDAVTLGGGTLINGGKGYLLNFEEAQKREVPTFTFGTGVCDPAFWSSIGQPRNTLPQWIDHLEKCHFVGVRGPLSQDILQEHGFQKSQIIGDPALSLAQEKKSSQHNQKHLGMNIGISHGNVWGKEDEILEKVVTLASILLEKNWEITFLPVWNEDLPYIQEACKRLHGKPRIFEKYLSIPDVMKFLQTCHLFVGEKLHSVILAMASYVPSIMLEYRPKCRDFMASMDLEKFNVRADQIDPKHVMSLIEELNTRWDFYQSQIYSKVRYYQEKQTEHSQSILKDLIHHHHES